MTIPSDHLRACEEHGIVGGGAGGSGPCPACATGIESRPEDVIEAKPLDLRWQVEPETLIELIPLTQAYLESADEGPAWVGIARLPKGEMPAGYTKQERWFNVLRYQFGAMVKTIIQESNARETIDALRDHGFGEETDGQ